MFEPPITGDDEPSDDVLADEVAALVDAGRRGDAVDRFLAAIGVPDEVIAGMADSKPALEAVAHTLAYDAPHRRLRHPRLVGACRRPGLGGRQ